MSRGLMRALSTLAILAVTWANQLSTARAVCDTYTVQAGDSAVSIADKLQIDYDELLSALQSCIGFVEGSMLQIGQTVCLPPYTPACRFVSSSGECTRYTVQYGDTLSMVASSFELDMEALAEVNNLNLTTPVRPNARLVLPPAGKGCGVSTVSKPSTSSLPPDAKPVPSPPSNPPKDVANSKCKMWLSSGGESIASIAQATGVDIGDLKRANGDKYPKSTDVTEPGAFVYIPPFDKKCEQEDVVLVNRPQGAEGSVSVGGQQVGGQQVGGQQVGDQQVPVSTQDASASAPAQAPATQGEEEEEAFLPAAAPTEESIPVDRLAVDVYLSDMSREEFASREYNFRENMAYAANISVVDVDVRFSLEVSSLSSRKRFSARKLLQGDEKEDEEDVDVGDDESDYAVDDDATSSTPSSSTPSSSTPSGSYYKVNTALFGPAGAVYEALSASIDSGAFPEMMDADGFNVAYVTAMHPDTVTLYNAATDPNNVTDAITASEPFYAPLSMWAFIGICIGGGVAVILLVGALCWCRSRRKRSAAEKKSAEFKAARNKEAIKHRKIVESQGLGGSGKMGGKGEVREIRVDAYASMQAVQTAPQGAARLAATKSGAREASIAPAGDREQTFTNYLLDGSTSVDPRDTPRYSTATPRRDDNSMGQELTRRASSATEATRGFGSNRDAVITPRTQATARTTKAKREESAVKNTAVQGGVSPNWTNNRCAQTSLSTPRGSSFSGTARRESSPSRPGVTPRGRSFTANGGASSGLPRLDSPRRTPKASNLEF